MCFPYYMPFGKPRSREKIPHFFLRYPQERAITGLLNEISSQAGVNYGLMAASVVLVVVPVLIVYICLQKHIIKGLTAGAIKG